ncbi:MAG: Crp/Fnr family transcriptional regulator [Saprospiraceae bacterium]|nr:Crp/Fnr family transcriptional regulator [Saprospiraceae bacterium]
MFSQHQVDCTCIHCLAKNPPFSYLTHDELEILDQNKNIVNYNPGEIIVKQGSSMTHLLSFYSGLAKIYLEGINGHNLILQLIKGGDFFIGPGVYTDFKHHSTISAITRSTACFVNLQVYLDIMNRNPVFANQNHKAENIKKINALKKIVSLTQKQMPGRIADALLYLHDNIYGTNPFKIDISRRELADMTALSKESVIRILKQFRDDEIIEVKGSRIEILDLAAVRHYSEVG